MSARDDMGGAVALGVFMGAFILLLPFIATLRWAVIWSREGRGNRLAFRLIGRHVLVYLKVVGWYMLASFLILPFFHLAVIEALLNWVILGLFAWEGWLFYTTAADLLRSEADEGISESKVPGSN